MLEKLDTQSFATYIGNGVAIPHGMSEGSKYVIDTGISVIQVPEGVDWNEEKAYIIVGIAANSDDHMNVLASLADAIEDIDKPIVTTCGSGVTACILALALFLIGKEDVAVYDGSWSEWGSLSETPVMNN